MKGYMVVMCGGNLALVQTKAAPKVPGDVGRSLEAGHFK